MKNFTYFMFSRNSIHRTQKIENQISARYTLIKFFVDMYSRYIYIPTYANCMFVYVYKLDSIKLCTHQILLRKSNFRLLSWVVFCVSLKNYPNFPVDKRYYPSKWKSYFLLYFYFLESNLCYVSILYLNLNMIVVRIV